MTEIVFFHHALGRTAAIEAFADALRAAGHTVHLPDLYEGRTFATLDEGMGHIRALGSETIIARGAAAVADLPAALVYAGYSLGVMPAQYLAQTRPGARAALLIESCVPPEAFGGPWPAQLPVQIHGMENDPIFAGEGDLEAAQNLVESVGVAARLFLYPGDGHLFIEPGLSAYDPAATATLLDRAKAYLAGLD